MIEDDFLLVNPRERTMSHPYPGITPTPSMITSGFSGGELQTGRGTNIVSFIHVSIKIVSLLVSLLISTHQFL